MAVYFQPFASDMMKWPVSVAICLAALDSRTIEPIQTDAFQRASALVLCIPGARG
jgi:hypothetical protein